MVHRQRDLIRTVLPRVKAHLRIRRETHGFDRDAIWLRSLTAAVRPACHHNSQAKGQRDTHHRQRDSRVCLRAASRMREDALIPAPSAVSVRVLSFRHE